MELRREVCRRLHEEHVAAREEIRGAFVASAPQARWEMAGYDQVMQAADVHQWLLARAGGGKAARPRARKLRK